MSVDIAKLRELLAAGTPRPRLSNVWIETNREWHGFSSVLIVEAINALPELLAIAEAAMAWGERMRRYDHKYLAADTQWLLAAVDAARKAGT